MTHGQSWAITAILAIVGAFPNGSLTATSGGYSADNSGVWILVAFVLVVGGYTALTIHFDRVRSANIQAFARSIGATFRRAPTNEDLSLPNGCQLAELGHDRFLQNVLEVARTQDLNFTLFDYHYRIGYDSKSRADFDQTISRMESPLLNLPAFILFPETFFAKIGKAFGRMDINFAEDSAFSAKYILRGEDEISLRALFTPAIREFLQPLQRLTVEARGNVIFVYRESVRTNPEKYAALIEEDKRILALLVEPQPSSADRVPKSASTA